MNEAFRFARIQRGIVFACPSKRVIWAIVFSAYSSLMPIATAFSDYAPLLPAAIADAIADARVDSGVFRMSAMYLSEQEKAALKATNIRQVEELLDQAMWDLRTTSLRDLRLASCGPFVAERLRRFERDLAEYAKAKAEKKRAETQTRARRAGSDLLYAIRDMQHRMAEEEKETELFRVDDVISPPYRFRDRIEVRVGYQWRGTVDDEWTYGSIEFIQDVDMRPDYTLPAPKRKPSAAKQEDARQETLYKHWEHLVTLALHAVRGYLKSGGDGSAIPDTFQAKTDGRSRWLNNLSCNFWQNQS